MTRNTTAGASRSMRPGRANLDPAGAGVVAGVVVAAVAEAAAAEAAAAATTPGVIELTLRAPTQRQNKPARPLTWRVSRGDQGPPGSPDLWAAFLFNERG